MKDSDYCNARELDAATTQRGKHTVAENPSTGATAREAAAAI